MAAKVCVGHLPGFKVEPCRGAWNELPQTRDLGCKGPWRSCQVGVSTEHPIRRISHPPHHGQLGTPFNCGGVFLPHTGFANSLEQADESLSYSVGHVVLPVHYWFLTLPSAIERTARTWHRPHKKILRTWLPPNRGHVYRRRRHLHVFVGRLKRWRFRAPFITGWSATPFGTANSR